eukprot:TRINITY_DN31976_c0_g4_i1.p1 TRINITY_DN31976_c0_g4~~TRINITY_DN31976_c0_g4_i1.p1  ORF type:complete len:283 (-),score=30.96 TRINITY_DN31976_c0_g4_i1:489-1337(-)
MWYHVVQNISASFAFFPPTPSYSVENVPNQPNKLKFIYQSQDVTNMDGVECFYLNTPKMGGYGNQKIVAVFLKHERAKTTLLYSHGNATDLGYAIHSISQLMRQTRCNILCYDYTGYGRSSPGIEPKPNHTLADIKACYNCLVHTKNINPKNIVLYGESLGSGPTVWLASKTPEIGGVILHAALLSGLRVLAPGASWWPSVLDVYPNDKLIKDIRSPVQIIHGEHDEVIGVEHGKKLHSLAKTSKTPLWVPRGHHNDLTMYEIYYHTVNKFVAEIEKNLVGN